MNKFKFKISNQRIRNWFSRNHTKITWFIIGILVLSGCQSIAFGHYVTGLISFGFAYLNYYLSH